MVLQVRENKKHTHKHETMRKIQAKLPTEE
jgi:hypothetical protein